MKNNNNPVHTEAAEMKQVRRDLIYVIVLNVILFAVLIGLYLVNRSSGKVYEFFSNILKF